MLYFHMQIFKATSDFNYLRENKYNDIANQNINNQQQSTKC